MKEFAKKKDQVTLKILKLMKKIQFFVIRRLEILNELLDKFKFFKRSVKPFMILNSSKKSTCFSKLLMKYGIYLETDQQIITITQKDSFDENLCFNIFLLYL